MQTFSSHFTYIPTTTTRSRCFGTRKSQQRLNFISIFYVHSLESLENSSTSSSSSSSLSLSSLTQKLPRKSFSITASQQGAADFLKETSNKHNGKAENSQQHNNIIISAQKSFSSHFDDVDSLPLYPILAGLHHSLFSLHHPRLYSTVIIVIIIGALALALVLSFIVF